MKDPPDPPPLSPGVQRLPERSGRESFFPGIKGNVKNRECAGGNRIAPTPHSKGFFRQHGKPGEAEAEPTEFRVHHAGKARTKQLGRGNIPKIRAQKSREFHGMKQRESPAGARGSGRDRAEFPREGRELRGREFHAWEGPRPGWGLEHPGIGERPCPRIRLDRDGQTFQDSAVPAHPTWGTFQPFPGTFQPFPEGRIHLDASGSGIPDPAAPAGYGSPVVTEMWDSGKRRRIPAGFGIFELGLIPHPRAAAAKLS